MSPAFKNGTNVNAVHRKKKLKYIRIRSGPQRDQYVHMLVCRAKIVGRREAWERDHPGVPIPDNDFYSLDYETVDHGNGNSLDNEPTNLTPMTDAENQRRRGVRHRARKAAKANVPF